jgi:hypothetical protein
LYTKLVLEIVGTFSSIFESKFLNFYTDDCKTFLGARFSNF